jgi:signal transduction histidine kinase
MALAVGSVGVLEYVLFRAEQYRLIDSRIEATATILISSDLSSAELHEFEEAEDIIHEVVGGERFNQFIIVYGKGGKELYRSPNAVGLPDKIPTDNKWQTIESDDQLIRVLTLPLTTRHPGYTTPTRTLQTGLILNEDLLRLKSVSQHVIGYSVVILCLILLTTAWLSQALLRPLKELAQYLRHLGSRLDSSDRSPPIPMMKAGDDEFGMLVKETELLRDAIGKGLRNTQAWTAQMAHEMKTPLTILQNSIERVQDEDDKKIVERGLSEAKAEVEHLNSLISSFLEWSAAENYPGTADDLHAVRLDQAARGLVEKFEHQFGARVKLIGESSLTVFAKRGFVLQAISNLLTNALKYSPPDSEVVIQISPTAVEILDEGPGISKAVREHLGEPFNYGITSQHGFGLGLAWVQTICRKYGWSLTFERKPIPKDGLSRPVTVARIEFPNDESE